MVAIEAGGYLMGPLFTINAIYGIVIESTEEFNEWRYTLTNSIQLQVAKRIERIQEYSHFGDVKNLGDGLAELRWKNGLRIYFSASNSKRLLLLLGGTKNAQKKDIKKARILLSRYANFHL